jgi:hypothetical protein
LTQTSLGSCWKMRGEILRSDEKWEASIAVADRGGCRPRNRGLSRLTMSTWRHRCRRARQASARPQICGPEHPRPDRRGPLRGESRYNLRPWGAAGLLRYAAQAGRRLRRCGVDCFGVRLPAGHGYRRGQRLALCEDEAEGNGNEGICDWLLLLLLLLLLHVLLICAEILTIGHSLHPDKAAAA